LWIKIANRVKIKDQDREINERDWGQGWETRSRSRKWFGIEVQDLGLRSELKIKIKIEDGNITNFWRRHSLTNHMSKE
jgi:hypothetical protein